MAETNALLGLSSRPQSSLQTPHLSLPLSGCNKTCSSASQPCHIMADVFMCKVDAVANHDNKNLESHNQFLHTLGSYHGPLLLCSPLKLFQRGQSTAQCSGENPYMLNINLDGIWDLLSSSILIQNLNIFLL